MLNPSDLPLHVSYAITGRHNTLLSIVISYKFWEKCSNCAKFYAQDLFWDIMQWNWQNKEKHTENLRISGYLARCERHDFLSSVFYLHVLPENWWRISQKSWKFSYFWAKIHKVCVVLGVSCPLVVNNFSDVKIHDFYSTKEQIKQLVSNQIHKQITQWWFSHACLNSISEHNTTGVVLTM